MNLAIPRRSALLLVPILLLLSGCFGAAVLGTGAGVMMMTDRRASETQVTDEGIELRASSRISEKLGDAAHINVTSYNRVVLLTGEVPNAAAKAEAESQAAKVANVRAISNELTVAGASALTSRSNDAYITSKVKARFVDARRFSANHVKVVTEAGVVFLLGLVTQAEADAAVDVARTTGGVLKVVRLFDIITPEQARAADGPKASTKPASSGG